MATIKEDYVSFEIAKMLKEKGFNEELDMIYSQYGDLHKIFDLEYYNTTYEFSTVSNSHYNDVTRIKYDFFATAPTLQMAMKWLREVHHIYLNINVRVILGQWSGYDISIHTIDNNGFLNKKIPIVLNDNTSYEQALEAAIKYCLEHLI